MKKWEPNSICFATWFHSCDHLLNLKYFSVHGETSIENLMAMQVLDGSLTWANTGMAFVWNQASIFFYFFILYHVLCSGKFLRLYWRRDYHAVLERTKTQFDQCSVADGNWTGKPAWNQTTFPDPKTTSGFSLDGKPDNTYYIICPIGGGSHCYQGMKLKIHVKPNCFYWK